MKTVWVLSSMFLFLVSCSPKLSPDHNWAEGSWLLTELKEVPVQIGGDMKKNAHLEFRPSAKTYEGFGGCNKISGSYTIGDGKIKFIASSAKHAPCPDVPFEATFLSLLKDVDRYNLKGNVMTLKDGNKTVIKLERK